MPEFSKNTDHPVLTAKVVNSWNGLKKPFLAQVGYHPPDFRGVCGWAKQNWAEQPLTNRVPLLVGCLDTAVASLLPSPFRQTCFSQRLQTSPPANSEVTWTTRICWSCHRRRVVFSASFVCRCVPHRSRPALRSASRQPCSCRGSGCPGISLCSPASPPAQTERRRLIQQLLRGGGESSRSPLAFALLLITSGLTGVGALVPHVSGSLVFTPARCF